MLEGKARQWGKLKERPERPETGVCACVCVWGGGVEGGDI